MIGAIIGDVVGSTREFSPIRTKDFVLIPEGSSYTDDSLMTIAVGIAMKEWIEAGSSGLSELSDAVARHMRAIGRRYPRPMGAYGASFAAWLESDTPAPYNSWGNGSAMRVSAAAEFATTLAEAIDYAEATARPTHNHPEGIKGAQATAAAVFLARSGSSKAEIRDYIDERFYPMDRTLDDIRPDYGFKESCQETVPESLVAFVESTSFEDALRNVVSLGGDADTMGAITGAVAWAYYSRTTGSDSLSALRDEAVARLPVDLKEALAGLEARIA